MLRPMKLTLLQRFVKTVHAVAASQLLSRRRCVSVPIGDPGITFDHLVEFVEDKRVVGDFEVDPRYRNQRPLTTVMSIPREAIR